MGIFQSGHEIRKRQNSREKHLVIQYLVLIGMLVFLVFIPKFGMWSIIQALDNISLIAIVSCGVTLLMASGQFNLSVGSTVAFSSMICAWLVLYTSNVPLAVTGAVAAGVFCGAVNGWLVGYLGLSSLFVTLGTQILFRGMAYIVGGGSSIYAIRNISIISRTTFFGLPVSIVVMVITAVILQIVLDNTLFGRYLLAIGNSRKTAQNAGIDVRKNIFWNYVLTGALCGIVGILLTVRMNYGEPNGAESYEYDALIISLLGGVSIKGGYGFIFGTILGAVLWGMLGDAMNYWGIIYFYQRVVKGLIIIVVLMKEQDVLKKLRQKNK